MAIDDKDIKLLWGNAANRCSMPECRRQLVVRSEDSSSDKIVGEMAHIVGDKDSETSPRGISSLPVEDRNRYKNLILLCAHHHTVIDKDEKNWPVEKLHKIKKEHELWVERLGESVDEELQIYHDFIDRVSIAFCLENWERLCDSLFRQIMDVDFPDGIYQLDFELFRSLLPGKIPDFEVALQNLAKRSRTYLDYYMSDAVIVPGDSRIMNKKRYKYVSYDNWEERDRLVKEYKLWQRNCNMLLNNLVKAINDFSEVVRKHLNPTFFIRKGKFCVHDFMGLMGCTLTETWYLPERYFSDEELAEPLKNKEELGC